MQPASDQSRRSTTYTQQADASEQGPVYDDFLSSIRPEEAGTEWSYAIISEPSMTGEPIRYGRVHAEDRPDDDAVRDLLPRDSDMHTLHVDFRCALGRRLCTETLVLIAHAPEVAPAGPSALDLAKAQPGAQMMAQSMELVRETNKVNLELTRFMIEDSREVRKINADQRKNEIDQLGKMVAKVSDGLSTMGQTATDPLTSTVQTLAPWAMKAATFVGGLAMAQVVKHGGPAEAAKAVMGHIIGRTAGSAAGSAAAETIKPLMEQGLKAAMAHSAGKMAKAQADAKVAAAEARARQAEAEMAKAEAELALAEAKAAAAEAEHQRHAAAQAEAQQRAAAQAEAQQRAAAPTAAPPPRRVEPHLEVPPAPEAEPVDDRVFDVEAVEAVTDE